MFLILHHILCGNITTKAIHTHTHTHSKQNQWRITCKVISCSSMQNKTGNKGHRAWQLILPETHSDEGAEIDVIKRKENTLISMSHRQAHRESVQYLITIYLNTIYYIYHKISNENTKHSAEWDSHKRDIHKK